MRETTTERRARLRAQWIITQGNCCALCGTRQGPFDVDHIDPATKQYRITDVWLKAKTIRDEELAKCQLLCEPCHLEKTRMELMSKTRHGTFSMYYRRKCRCSTCLEWRVKDNARQRDRYHRLKEQSCA